MSAPEDLVHRYAHAFDDDQLDDLAGLFADEATFTMEGLDHGPVHLRGRGEIMVALTRSRRAPGGLPRRHVMSNVVELAGDDRRSTLASYLTLTVLEQGAWRIRDSGRYLDVVVRDQAGRWVFESRTLTIQGAQA